MGQLKKPEIFLFEWTVFMGFVAHFGVRRRIKTHINMLLNLWTPWPDPN